MCHMSCVTCHMSCVTCQVSHVKKNNFFFDNVVELVNGGSVINGAYPVQFSSSYCLHCLNSLAFGFVSIFCCFIVAYCFVRLPSTVLSIKEKEKIIQISFLLLISIYISHKPRFFLIEENNHRVPLCCHMLCHGQKMFPVQIYIYAMWQLN